MSQLIDKTQDFFNRHWDDSESSPSWNFGWNWSGPVPNYLLGGLYALFSGEKLVYVGLGNSRGGGSYQERGISRRLEAHVLDIAPQGHTNGYIPKKRWADAGINKIATIGFPEKYSYLAPALEDFLIGELNPPENSIRKKST